MRRKDLSLEDWQPVEFAVRRAIDKARPKPKEGKPSKEFLEQEKRIMRFLMSKAYR